MAEDEDQATPEASTVEDDVPELADIVGPDLLVGVLPLRDSVVFPRSASAIRIGRPSSVAVVNAALADRRVVLAVKQRETQVDEPRRADLEDVGCVAGIVRMNRSPEGAVDVLLHGLRRVRIGPELEPGEILRAHVEVVHEQATEEPEAGALLHAARAQLARLKALVAEMPPEVITVAHRLSRPGALADVIASFLEIDASAAQRLLEQTDEAARMRAVLEHLERQLHALQLSREIRDQVEQAIGDRQTEMILREQLQAIQQRLGEGTDDGEAKALSDRIAAIDLPQEARTEVDRELARLARTPEQSAEHGVIRTYLETMADLPWTVLTEDQLDLAHAQRILDEDHHGLAAVKDRILELLAVRRFRPDSPSPTLCFVGPPGTGKTSLGRSIARALGRAYVRQSLGGIHDEAEIRGHRRTYVGAMPGRIISALRRAGTRNPVIVLDEIDKVGQHARGDPHAALLEVLDPQQNEAFVDNYLGVAFDLSRVMFVCTANILDTIPGPLRDRMEVIRLPGYTPTEKREIARRHIVPRELAALGLEGEGIEIDDEALDLLIAGYTREAGVRDLARQVTSTLRKLARHLVESRAEHEEPRRRIDVSRVRELLGHPRHLEPELPPLDRPGTALGLAWTPVGGEVLVIEAVSRSGKDGLTLTGQLGEVMKESATAALSLLRANATALGAELVRRECSIHLHVPAGAVPKDGPSAGIAMFVALASLCTGRLPVEGVAMTGEITLRGRVLPVGGIKEKVLGAHRAGIRTVILPRRNEPDLEEIPKEIRAQLRFVLIDEALEALATALAPATTPVHEAVASP